MKADSFKMKKRRISCLQEASPWTLSGCRLRVACKIAPVLHGSTLHIFYFIPFFPRSNITVRNIPFAKHDTDAFITSSQPLAHSRETRTAQASSGGHVGRRMKQSVSQEPPLSVFETSVTYYKSGLHIAGLVYCSPRSSMGRLATRVFRAALRSYCYVRKVPSFTGPSLLWVISHWKETPLGIRISRKT